ncbi:MAG: FkbM family methyltransferase [Acidobacteriota bacterium]
MTTSPLNEQSPNAAPRRRRVVLRRLAAVAVTGLGIVGAWALGPQLAAQSADTTQVQEKPPSRILHTETKLYSQNDEELVIRDFFQDRRGGVFLDVGAGPWKNNSTTLYLEKHLDWTGVSVDALERYRKGYEKNRPGSRFEAYAVTDRSGGTIPFYALGDLSSTDPSWKDRFRKVADRTARVIEVPQITLNDLLDRLEVERIDFLSMDIEGGEEKALAGFDIERFAPELVCIEMKGGVESQALREYFESHGYDMLTAYRPYDSVNRYFARRTDKSPRTP